jgi:hypothetical protein
MVAQVLIPLTRAVRRKSKMPACIDPGCKLCDIGFMNFNLSSPAATAFVLCCDRALWESDT